MLESNVAAPSVAQSLATRLRERRGSRAFTRGTVRQIVYLAQTSPKVKVNRTVSSDMRFNLRTRQPVLCLQQRRRKLSGSASLGTLLGMYPTVLGSREASPTILRMC